MHMHQGIIRSLLMRLMPFVHWYFLYGDWEMHTIQMCIFMGYNTAPCGIIFMGYNIGPCGMMAMTPQGAGILSHKYAHNQGIWKPRAPSALCWRGNFVMNEWMKKHFELQTLHWSWKSFFRRLHIALLCSDLQRLGYLPDCTYLYIDID